MALNREKVWANANKLLRSGKHDKAISEFQRLLEDNPTDVRSALKMGDTFVKLGRRSEAIDCYHQVATVHREQGFFLKAVAVYKQMLRVDNTLVDVHLKLAEMYQQLGLTSDCMMHYQQVALQYEKAGDLEQTLRILARMTELAPDNIPSRIKLAELYAQQGQTAEAVKEFQSAGDFLKNQGRVDQYVQVAERMVFFDPSRIDVIRELAHVYLRRGDPKLALGKLQICFKAEPRNLETLTLIAEAFMSMEQMGKTLSVYKEMARIYDSGGQRESAQRHWQRVLELDPQDKDAQHALGLSDELSSPNIKALSSGEQATAKEEEEKIKRLLTETTVYIKYGLRDKAVEHLNTVLEIRPSSLDAMEKMREIHLEAQEEEQAQALLEQLISAAKIQSDPRLETYQAEYAALLDAQQEAEAVVLDDDDVVVLSAESAEATDEHYMSNPNASQEHSENTQEQAIPSWSQKGQESKNTDEGDNPYYMPVPSMTKAATTGVFEDPLMAELAKEASERRKIENPVYGKTDENNLEDDPAAEFFIEELQEAEFFIKQGFIEEAREILLEIQEDVPNSPRVQKLLKQLDAAPEQGPEDDEPTDLPAILDEEPQEASELTTSGSQLDASGQVSVEEVLEQFKQGVAETVSADDAETHCNLGIAYREMGLLEDAIGAFKLALNSPEKGAYAHHMIGLTLMMMARYEEALSEFDQALQHARNSKEEIAGNQYQRGECLEHLARYPEAVQAFQIALENGSKIQDIQSKIDRLKRSIESDTVPPSHRDKVDYL